MPHIDTDHCNNISSYAMTDKTVGSDENTTLSC